MNKHHGTTESNLRFGHKVHLASGNRFASVRFERIRGRKKKGRGRWERWRKEEVG